MQTELVDGTIERKLLIACIVSSSFLSKLGNKLGEEPFRSKWSNILWSWCKDYFTNYNKAPEKEIESLLALWANQTRDKDDLTTIQRLISSLSGEYTQSPEESGEFLLDLAEDYFNKVRVERLVENLRSNKNIDISLNLVEGFRKLNLKIPPFVDVLRDKTIQREALDSKQRKLITYPGPAGEFFGDELAEDSFVGVMAQMKGKKSYLLLDMAWRALRQGRKVAYFQVGDMSKLQVLRRFHRRAAYRPIEAKKVKYPIGMILGSPKDPAMVEYEDRDFEQPISWRLVEKAYESILAKTNGDLRISYHPVKTINASEIKNILEDWDREGWYAQCVFVDYAWNLASLDGKAGPVDQVSYTWAMLRQISEIRKCLVVTANQTNKEGFSSWVLTRKHFSESKMILAHTTSFLGVNATSEESSMGQLRLNWIVRREEAFSENYCLFCASCLDLANPIVLSVLPQ